VDGFQYVNETYEATRIASSNTIRIAEAGAYDEKTGQTSADAMVATSYLSFGSIAEWKGVEIKYTRRPK
jgi:hypothetical protein